MTLRALRGSSQDHGGSSSGGGIAPGKRARTDGFRKRMPDPLRGRMERAFGADFSDVKLNTDSAATQGADARAMAEGDELSFAPGNYDPDSDQGVELIAHELAHVVQQRQGRVAGPQGKGGEVRSAELEREADDVAARVAAGGSAGLGEAPASASSSARQLKLNEIDTVMGKIDPKTGLEEAKAELVDKFVQRVQGAVGTWASQRATADLIFHGEGEVDAAFDWFNEKTLGDPDHDRMQRAAAQALQLGKTVAYAQEIRLFNVTMLIKLKSLLGLADVADSHQYQYRPLWGIGGTIGKHGVKVGAIAKDIEIKYTCTAIPGLEWTQVVTLKGWVFGAGFSVGDLADLKKKKKTKGEGAGSGPGKWSEKKDQAPRRRYLPPAFFDGAGFSSPSGSASVNLGPAVAKKDLGSALLIYKGADQLLWEESMDASLISSAELNMDPAELDEFELDAGAEVSQESGVTSLSGGTTFKSGEWAEVEDKKDDAKQWMPLHGARIFFDTGDSVLRPEDWDTLQKLCALIKQWDDKPKHHGSAFLVTISGCHSQRWKDYDETLRGLDEHRDDDGQLTKRDALREADVLGKKGAENYELALMRAEHTHMVFSMLLGRTAKQLSLNVQANSGFAPPTTHMPHDENRFSNAETDRSVTIGVWYQI